MLSVFTQAGLDPSQASGSSSVHQRQHPRNQVCFPGSPQDQARRCACRGRQRPGASLSPALFGAGETVSTPGWLLLAGGTPCGGEQWLWGQKCPINIDCGAVVFTINHLAVDGGLLGKLLPPGNFYLSQCLAVSPHDNLLAGCLPESRSRVLFSFLQKLAGHTQGAGPAGLEVPSNSACPSLPPPGRGP